MDDRTRKRTRGRSRRGVIDCTAMPPDVRTVIAAPPAGAVEKIPYVGPLDTPAHYRKFLNRVIREVRRGVIPSQVGTRLGWLIRQGFDMVYREEALAEAKRIRELLESQPASAKLPPPFADELTDNLLPALEPDCHIGEKS